VLRVTAAAEDDAAAVADSVNTTVMTSCSMCAEQLTVRALTTRLCAADFGEHRSTSKQYWTDSDVFHHFIHIVRDWSDRREI